MSDPAPIVDLADKSVSLAGTTYAIRPLGDDAFTALVEGIPVGKLVYTFGAAMGVPEGSAVSEETLTAIAEAWFAALDA